MIKTIEAFLIFSGILFWILFISLFIPSNIMGTVGLIGIYMQMFGYPWLFYVLILGSIFLAFTYYYKLNKLKIKEQKYYRTDMEAREDRQKGDRIYYSPSKDRYFIVKPCKTDYFKQWR